MRDKAIYAELERLEAAVTRLMITVEKAAADAGRMEAHGHREFYAEKVLPFLGCAQGDLISACGLIWEGDGALGVPPLEGATHA